MGNSVFEVFHNLSSYGLFKINVNKASFSCSHNLQKYFYG